MEGLKGSCLFFLRIFVVGSRLLLSCRCTNYSDNPLVARILGWAGERVCAVWIVQGSRKEKVCMSSVRRRSPITGTTLVAQGGRWRRMYQGRSFCLTQRAGHNSGTPNTHAFDKPMHTAAAAAAAASEAVDVSNLQNVRSKSNNAKQAASLLRPGLHHRRSAHTQVAVKKHGGSSESTKFAAVGLGISVGLRVDAASWFLPSTAGDSAPTYFHKGCVCVRKPL